MEIQKKVYDEFKHLFSISIPSNLRERVLYEKKSIQSIRSSLQKNNLLLRRTADNRNTFYIGDRHEFQMKGEHYLDRSFVYEILIAKHDQLSHEQQQQERNTQMKEMIESMNLLLEELKRHKSLDDKTINQLRLDASCYGLVLHIVSLYFVGLGLSFLLFPFFSFLMLYTIVNDPVTVSFISDDWICLSLVLCDNDI